MMKSILMRSLLAGCIALSAGEAFAKGPNGNGKGPNEEPSNVIVMIPDGCDETVQTVARWYKGADLEVDGMKPGTVKVHMANSIIPGSAAAATAFATGHKTTVRFLGIGPRTDDLLTGFVPTAAPYAPVASVLEAAKLEGKSVGIVVSCRVTHATPAAFGCHIQDRGWDNDIMEHLVYNDIDVVFGGGARHLIPSGESYTTTFGETWGGKRIDGANLMDVLADRGYQFVDNKTDMAAVTSGKVWGLFDDSHMNPDIDRQVFDAYEPSLAEMVAKAIEILSQDPDGFLLMVEGPQVDWAGHNNDPIYMVTDFLAFDDAVKVANDFAADNGNTTVMAFPDHNTGGMKLGHYETAVGYTETRIEDLVDVLKGMKMSANAVVALADGAMDAAGDTDIVPYLEASVSNNWGIVMTAEDIDEITELAPSVGLSYALARVISENHTVIGWTTHGHTGETVPLWINEDGIKAPGGVIDNTKLARMAARVIGANLGRSTAHLFVDLDTVTMDYTIADDTLYVAGAEMPLGTDLLIKDGMEMQMPGVTVYAPATGKVYVSKEAISQLGL
jgi:alkaline phosphatase